jgi:hypothetical protein
MIPCTSESMRSQDSLQSVTLRHEEFPANEIDKLRRAYHLVLQISRLKHQPLGTKSNDFFLGSKHDRMLATTVVPILIPRSLTWRLATCLLSSPDLIVFDEDPTGYPKASGPRLQMRRASVMTLNLRHRIAVARIQC